MDQAARAYGSWKACAKAARLEEGCAAGRGGLYIMRMMRSAARDRKGWRRGEAGRTGARPGQALWRPGFRFGGGEGEAGRQFARCSWTRRKPPSCSSATPSVSIRTCPSYQGHVLAARHTAGRAGRAGCIKKACLMRVRKRRQCPSGAAQFSSRSQPLYVDLLFHRRMQSRLRVSYATVGIAS